MTEVEAWSVLTTKVKWSQAQWQTYFSLPKSAQISVAQNIKDAVWPEKGTSAWDEFIVALGVLATIAGDLSGIGTAYAVIKAL
jgi:hypothetical protein